MRLVSVITMLMMSEKNMNLMTGRKQMRELCLWWQLECETTCAGAGWWWWQGTMFSLWSSVEFLSSHCQHSHYTHKSNLEQHRTVIQEKHKSIKWVQVKSTWIDKAMWEWLIESLVDYNHGVNVEWWGVMICDRMELICLLQIVLLKGVCVLQFSVLIWYLHQLVVVQLRTGLSMVYQLIPNIKPCENNHIHDAEARRENWVEQ